MTASAPRRPQRPRRRPPPNQPSSRRPPSTPAVCSTRRVRPSTPTRSRPAPPSRGGWPSWPTANPQRPARARLRRRAGSGDAGAAAGAGVAGQRRCGGGGPAPSALRGLSDRWPRRLRARRRGARADRPGDRQAGDAGGGRARSSTRTWARCIRCTNGRPLSAPGDGRAERRAGGRDRDCGAPDRCVPHGQSPYVGSHYRVQRAAQAEFIAGLVQGRQVAAPGEPLVVRGDFDAPAFTDGYVDVAGAIAGAPWQPPPACPSRRRTWSFRTSKTRWPTCRRRRATRRRRTAPRSSSITCW